MKTDLARCWSGISPRRRSTSPSYLDRLGKNSRDQKWLSESPRSTKLEQRIFIKENALIEDLIQRSKFILNIVSAEDESFVPYARGTWVRATSFLRRLSLRGDMALRDLPLPRIVPADGGSVDLLWKSGQRGLLINFPPDGEPATYYGRKPDILFSGALYSDDAQDEILNWLTS